jgi:hypothetical protein
VRSSREVAPLLDIMGGDPTGQQLEVAEFIQPVVMLDDAQFGLHNQKTIRQLGTFVPSVSALDTSAFQFISSRGVWVRRAFNLAANINWTVVGVQSVFTTTDGGGNGVVTIAPLGFPMGVAQTLVTGFPMNTFVAGNSQNLPNLNLFYAKGRVNPATLGGVGQFWSLNPTVPFLQDLWIPPGFGLYIESSALNTAFVLVVELEYPAATFISK